MTRKKNTSGMLTNRFKDVKLFSEYACLAYDDWIDLHVGCAIEVSKHITKESEIKYEVCNTHNCAYIVTFLIKT